jgi:hypothetical protein
VADNATASFTATATDQAGNVSNCSAPITYVEITPAPSNAFGVPAPSNAFGVRVNGKTLLVSVSAPGTVEVKDAAAPLSARASKKTALLLKPSSASGAPPSIPVPLRLSKTGNTKLKTKEKLTVKARITFTPEGGSVSTQTAKLKLKSKKSPAAAARAELGGSLLDELTHF